MKLTNIKISNFRSFVGEHEFQLADGVNYFVGANNCGKPNLIAALELAMDPNRIFVPERDRPARLQGSTKTRITTMIRCGSNRHYRLSKALEDSAIRILQRELRAGDEDGMIWLGEEINRRIEKVAAMQERNQLFAK